MHLRSRNHYNQVVQKHVTTMAEDNTRTPTTWQLHLYEAQTFLTFTRLQKSSGGNHE